MAQKTTRKTYCDKLKAFLQSWNLRVRWTLSSWWNWNDQRKHNGIFYTRKFIHLGLFSVCVSFVKKLGFFFKFGSFQTQKKDVRGQFAQDIILCESGLHCFVKSKPGVPNFTLSFTQKIQFWCFCFFFSHNSLCMRWHFRAFFYMRLRQLASCEVEVSMNLENSIQERDPRATCLVCSKFSAQKKNKKKKTKTNSYDFLLSL